MKNLLEERFKVSLLFLLGLIVFMIGGLIKHGLGIDTYGIGQVLMTTGVVMLAFNMFSKNK